jgi:hypothetical protein
LRGARWWITARPLILLLNVAQGVAHPVEPRRVRVEERLVNFLVAS